MPTDDDEQFGGSEEPTAPQGRFAPRSGIALTLADVTLSTNEAVRYMQLCSAEIDGLEGISRKARLAELGTLVVRIGGELVAFGEALKEESERG